MNHRDDECLVILQPIDHPTAVDDKFAYVLIIEFRHPAACTRKARKNPRLIHNVLENNGSVGGRIGSDVIGDGIEILWTARLDQAIR